MNCGQHVYKYKLNKKFHNLLGSQVVFDRGSLIISTMSFTEVLQVTTDTTSLKTFPISSRKTCYECKRSYNRAVEFFIGEKQCKIAQGLLYLK